MCSCGGQKKKGGHDCLSKWLVKTEKQRREQHCPRGRARDEVGDEYDDDDDVDDDVDWVQCDDDDDDDDDVYDDDDVD